MLMSSQTVAPSELHHPIRNRRSYADKSALAGLLASEISQMSTEELVHVVRDARDVLLGDRAGKELKRVDRGVLQMLVHRARRCCRDQGY